MSLDANDNIPAAGTSTEPNNFTGEEDVPVAGATEEEPNFETLLAAYEGKTQTFSEGEVIKGKVIAISGGGVIVDVGFKSEGIIPVEQFTDDHGEVSVQVGDSVDVFLEQTEDSKGHVVLSREKAERMKV